MESLQTHEPETLAQVVRSLKPADEDWLIFIDQFEELFTLCQSLQKRQAFINGLIRLQVMGASLKDISPLYLTLWGLSGIYCILAMVAMHFRLKTEFKRSKITE